MKIFHRDECIQFYFEITERQRERFDHISNIIRFSHILSSDAMKHFILGMRAKKYCMPIIIHRGTYFILDYYLLIRTQGCCEFDMR